MALLSCLSPFVSVAFSSLLSIQNFLCKQLLNRKAQISELCIGVTFVNIGLERLSWGNVKLKHEKEINSSFKILIFGLAVWCVVSQSGIQPEPSALSGGFLTTQPSGKPISSLVFCYHFLNRFFQPRSLSPFFRDSGSTNPARLSRPCGSLRPFVR